MSIKPSLKQKVTKLGVHFAQSNTDQSAFKQLQQELPTPNVYRAASGAPGHQYWQQKADYEIEATLDEKNLTCIGSETVTYINNSPDKLDYIWFHLWPNAYKNENTAFYKQVKADKDGAKRLAAIKRFMDIPASRCMTVSMCQTDKLDAPVSVRF